MKEKILTIAETDLASRFAAARFRSLVEKAILDGSKVTIDLGAVLSISESYADELFGVLAVRVGLEEFVERVRVRDASTSVIHAIANAVRRRLNLSASTPDFALLAARKALESRRQVRR